MKINIFILMLLMFSSYNKNIAEMELLEGTWLLSDPDINHYWSVSKNVSVEFVVYDVNKANAKYFEIVKYKNSIDTVSIEEGTLELQDKGKIINRNVNSTTIYFEQNIKELTSNVLRYSFTIREKNYDFSFRKQ